jgi:hypothetical protein
MAPIVSLSDLAGSIAPPRDLWPAINARLTDDGGLRIAVPGGSSRWRPSRMQLLAGAAAAAVLAICLWLGGSLLAPGGRTTPRAVDTAGIAPVLQVANVTDPRYLQEHSALIASLGRRLQTLPAETQIQVVASLATIRRSMRDIQAALGREPGNALLQELLVNNYQDEMRVLAAVHEAGRASEEI